MTRILIAASMLISATDMVEPEIPETQVEQKGICGATAYSDNDGEYGFFWGAGKRDEAEEIAVKHCGALAIAKDTDVPKTIWGSQSAEIRKDAEELSLKQCEA